MNVLHPLFVHLHIAFLLMAFVSMYAWLFRGLATSVFEDKLYRFARANTWLGVVTVALSMVAGLHDGIRGRVVTFDDPSQGGWLLVKVGLSLAMLVVYGLFLAKSRRKKRFLQEDRHVMLWCLGTQALGILLVAAVTTIGTMLVYYRTLLPSLPSPWVP